jgi:signal transduction histidine kinase
VLGVPLAGVNVHDDDELRALAFLDTVNETFDEPPAYRRNVSDPVDRLVWCVFEAGEPLLIDDTAAFDPELAANTPAESGILHPLGDHGVFIISATEPGSFDAGDRALVEVLANALQAAFDRVEREELLAERERQLTRENERLDEFAGIVSHDLRNPLSVAAGRVELAHEVADGPATDHLAAAIRALDRMEALIDDLLALARAGETVADTEPVALDGAVRDAWRGVGADDAALRVEPDAADRVIVADRGRLHQLFENLFGNALDHAGPDTTVTVGTLPEGFYVADDGPGVPASERGQVFEHGYTTSDTGVGLGLSVVADIAAGHGWEVAVTEAAAGGARFEFTGVDAAGE